MESTVSLLIRVGRRITEINILIEKAKIDGIMAIECDCTWESGYSFDKVELRGKRIYINYEEYNGTFKKKTDSYNLADAFQMLSWIKKCITKGYAQDRKDKIAEDKAEHAFNQQHPELNP